MSVTPVAFAARGLQPRKGPGEEHIRPSLDLEVPTRPVANAIPEPEKVLGQFMIINRLNILPPPQHLLVLQGLPPRLLRVVGRIENDAMRVQMRVECA